MSRIYTMHNYLSEKTPDYVGLLSVSPQKMRINGGKFINLNAGLGTFDYRVLISASSVFQVQLIWDSYIDSSDVDTIFDFYHDQNKACGIGHTFYWQAPAQYDGLIYVVRFNSDLSEFVSNFEVYDITSLDLYVCGKQIGLVYEDMIISSSLIFGSGENGSWRLQKDNGLDIDYNNAGFWKEITHHG